MEIGKIDAMGSGTAQQITNSKPTDQVSKNIENKISDVQRQIKDLSSKEEFSADEKVKKRQELRQEMSKLNTQLRQRQNEAVQEKRKAGLAAETEKEQRKKAAAGQKSGNAEEAGSKSAGSGKAAAEPGRESAKAGKQAKASENKTADAGRTTEAGVRSKDAGKKASEAGEKSSAARKKAAERNSAGAAVQTETAAVADGKAAEGTGKAADSEKTTAAAGMEKEDARAIISSGSAVKQIEGQGRVIARIEGGIAILKSEIRQDEARGMDAERKKEELAKEEKRAQKAAEFRKAVIEEAMQGTRGTGAVAGKDGNAGQKAGESAKDRMVINATNFSKDRNQEIQKASQQQLYAATDIFIGK